ncbi:hypothetical protein KYX90_13070, partial [Enterococcus lactis]|uniref:hypothetical protein n=1 Tax=Enterococcus lactis TaxID=357441 RepID=UPI001C7D16FE
MTKMNKYNKKQTTKKTKINKKNVAIKKKKKKFVMEINSFAYSQQPSHETLRHTTHPFTYYNI